MNTFKKVFCSVVGSVVFLSSTPAYTQGIPVYDNAVFLKNVTEFLENVARWKKQVEQLKAQIDAVTGDRGMANVATNQNRQYLPQEYQELTNLLDNTPSGYSNLAWQAEQIRQKNTVSQWWENSNLSGQTWQMNEDRKKSLAIFQAVGQESYNNSSRRIAILQQLVQRVSNLGDIKAAADLQARIQSEHVMLQNDASKLAMAAQQSAMEQQAYQQKAQEVAIRRSGNDYTNVAPLPLN